MPVNLSKFHLRAAIFFIAGVVVAALCIRGGTAVAIGAVFLSVLTAVVGVLIPAGPRGVPGPMGAGLPQPIPEDGCHLLVLIGGIARWLPIGEDGETFAQSVRDARERQNKRPKP